MHIVMIFIKFKWNTLYQSNWSSKWKRIFRMYSEPAYKVGKCMDAYDFTKICRFFLVFVNNLVLFIKILLLSGDMKDYYVLI